MDRRGSDGQAPGVRRRVARCALLLCLIGAQCASTVVAQGLVQSESGFAIEAVRIAIVNPDSDAALNRRIEDQARRILALFPRERFSREVLDYALVRVRRIPQLADATYAVDFGQDGGVVVELALTLRDAATATPPGVTATFPVLHDADGVYLKAKVEPFGLYYGNRNAWYGRPDLMLAGNPLAVGEAAGRGYDAWVEGYLHGGLYGIAPLSGNTHVYGGASAMATVSFGQELFTDKAQSYGALEDAFLGLITGRTADSGERWVLNLSAGRQRFTLGDGFLIVNTAGNGSNRAALQANARWAADFVALGQFRYNDTRIEAFRVDPDEVPVLDSRAILEGLNLETELLPGLGAAASYVQVPRSESSYFLPDGSRLGREGLQVHDLRMRWQPRPVGAPGIYLAAEAALQENRDFPMRATGWYAELGYAYADAPWAPTLGYRYSSFSGDDPGTARYERWDPLLSGGNGEQWVQGINHFKVVQNANVLAHRLQLRLRPHARLELVSQAWMFRADSLLNLGGNPALSILSSRDYGTELNLTARMYWSRNLYLHGHVAATFPGEAVELALDGTERNWWSAMCFVRYAF